jgi:hypothetical protein
MPPGQGEAINLARSMPCAGSVTVRAQINDILVCQTAIVGRADLLCTLDDDFYAEPTDSSWSDLASPSSAT